MGVVQAKAIGGGVKRATSIKQGGRKRALQGKGASDQGVLKTTGDRQHSRPSGLMRQQLSEDLVLRRRDEAQKRKDRQEGAQRTVPGRGWRKMAKKRKALAPCRLEMQIKGVGVSSTGREKLEYCGEEGARPDPEESSSDEMKGTGEGV